MQIFTALAGDMEDISKQLYNVVCGKKSYIL